MEKGVFEIDAIYWEKFNSFTKNMKDWMILRRINDEYMNKKYTERLQPDDQALNKDKESSSNTLLHMWKDVCNEIN